MERQKAPKVKENYLFAHQKEKGVFAFSNLIADFGTHQG